MSVRRCFIWLLAASSVLVAAPHVASAWMRLDGANGPLVLYGTDTRIQRSAEVALSAGFEADALQRFEREAIRVGYFGALVVDRSSAEIVYYNFGMHSVNDALALATAMCRTEASNPEDCVEAARAMPTGLILADTGATTLSKDTVPLFLDLVGKAGSGSGVTAVSISGVGHIAVSAPQPSRDEAVSVANSICRSILEEFLATRPVEEKTVLSALDLDECRAVFIQ